MALQLIRQDRIVGSKLHLNHNHYLSPRDFEVQTTAGLGEISMAGNVIIDQNPFSKTPSP